MSDGCLSAVVSVKVSYAWPGVSHEGSGCPWHEVRPVVSLLILRTGDPKTSSAFSVVRAEPDALEHRDGEPHKLDLTSSQLSLLL